MSKGHLWNYTLSLGIMVALTLAVALPSKGGESLDQILAALKPISLDEAALRKIAGKDHFEPYLLNPILSPGLRTRNHWDAGALGTACVIKVNGVFHMYYESWGELSEKGTHEEYRTLQIGHAVSLDGIHWAKDPANPVIAKGSSGEWDRGGTWDPFVIYEDGKFKMWYGGDDATNCAWGYAESQDSSYFEKKKQISPPGQVEDIHVVHDGASGDYVMYYWDRDRAPWAEVSDGLPSPSGLVMARSKNEVDFDFKNAKVLTIANQAWPSKYTHVVPSGEKWAMAFGEAVERGKPSSTGIAFSDDLVNWKKAAYPIITGHDADLIEAAPGLWLAYYGPHQYFDWPECDLNVAIYDGSLEELKDRPE